MIEFHLDFFRLQSFKEVAPLSYHFYASLFFKSLWNVLQYCFCFFLSFFLLPGGMWDLSSPTKDPTNSTDHQGSPSLTSLWWETWYLYFCFCRYWSFSSGLLGIVFFFKGFEHFNYDVTRHGFFILLCSFVHLAPWIGGLIIFTTIGIIWHCSSKNYFLSLGIFRNINHLCITSFNVALPLSDTVFIQFSSVQSLSRVQLFATPWTTARQASLSITNSCSSPRFASIKSVMPSSHLILCHPFSSAPNPSQPQSLFQWLNSSYEVAKVLEFQLQHQSFQWTPRTDFL